MSLIELVNVFTHAGAGGNPCPIVVDAGGLSAEDMRNIAVRYGHESGFVFPAASRDADYAFRFFVPRHEMEMCGHATIGALWLMATKGLVNREAVRIETRAGPVTGFVARSAGELKAEITQPAGKVIDLSAEASADVLTTLGLTGSDLLDLPIQNAVTSRVKTLVPVRSVDRLNAIFSDMARTEACCERIGSTGLYPYAIGDLGERVFEARQFPKSSGYPEDAATGIAAAALAFGLLVGGLVPRGDAPITVLQGRAMGRLSEIRVQLGFAGDRVIGCLLGGDVAQSYPPH